MPHYIKSLEIQGYKTFANRTRFEFAEKVTAIVGPNGSGKSNIVDALRWVLGEQSYGLLRGKRTDDMIFSGSEQRSRSGMASATVVFNNELQWLPIEFSEVAITRRAYRDGQNEYLLNGQKVRLRDVNELLSQAGLAERTYTIIGQGLVDVALSLRADERKRLFEEAAGIGLHRTRREESLRRLEITTRNLLRVQDIIAELAPRVKSLEVQTERVLKYEQVQIDLRIVLREWYGYHWHQKQKELLQAQEFSQQQEKALEEARNEQAKITQLLSARRDEIQTHRQQLNIFHRELAQLHRQREEMSRDLAVFSERERSFQEQSHITQAELARLREELSLHQERMQQSTEDLARQKVEVEEAQSQVNQAKQALQLRIAERDKIEQAIQITRKQLSELYAKRDRLQARISEKQAQIERQQTAILSAAEVMRKSEEELRKAQKNIQDAHQTNKNAIDEHQAAEAGAKQAQQKMLETEKKYQLAFEDVNSIKTQLTRLKAQLDVIQQAERSLTGYAQGTRLLIEAGRKAQLKGIKGALISSLDVPSELEVAIAAVLGDYIHAVVIETANTSDEALDLLNQKSTRATLLPIEVTKPNENLLLDSQDKRVIGIAADLIQAPEQMRSIIQLLLGHVVVVAHRENARQLLTELPQNACVVTLQGEVFYVSGQIIGGKSGSTADNSLLSRSRQQRELNQALQQTEAHLVVAERSLKECVEQKQTQQNQMQLWDEKARETQRKRNDADAHHHRMQLALEQTQKQYQWQQEQRKRLEEEIVTLDKETVQMNVDLQKLKEQLTIVQESMHKTQNDLLAHPLDELQSQCAYWETQAAVSQRVMEEAEQLKKERETTLLRTEKTCAILEQRKQETHQAQENLEKERYNIRQKEGEVQSQILSVQQQIEPVESELLKAEQEQENIQRQDDTTRQTLSRAEQRNAQASIQLAKAQESLHSLSRKIEDDFGLVSFDYASAVSGPTPLPIDGMVESLPLITELSPDLEETLQNHRRQLKRMGSINPEARKEYQEVSERYTFLKSQVEDLQNAEQDVHRIISELDTIMQSQFKETFETVSEEFKKVFTRLFGGGTVKLILTEPNDIINTGIDIEVRLPGRRTQGLSLLSGGERSLTATALIFALLKTSPTPFCVLDEVDAMLDEANVGRFRDLLNEVSQNTQIMIVTHNRNTVQVADVIYGVTMDRDTTSQVLSLRLDQVNDLKGVD